MKRIDDEIEKKKCEMHKHIIMNIFVLIIVILYFSCGDKNPAKPILDDQDKVIIPKTTKIIDENDWMNQLITISPDSSIFTLDANVQSAYNFAANDILSSAKARVI